MTVGLDDFLGLGLSPRTAYLYARMVIRVNAVLADRGVDLLSCGPVDVAAVAAAIGPSHSLRQRLRAALAKSWELLDRFDGPIRAVRVPPKPRGRCKALDEDVAVVLERAAWARDDDAGLAVLLGLYAGLRRMEIARVRGQDLTVDGDGVPTWLRVYGKGDLVADIPVHPVLAVALTRRLRGSGGYLFPGRWPGHPVNPATIWAWVKLVAADAGLEVNTHVLRHTALAEANDRSSDLRAVQEFARHARPETTAGYTRVRSRRLADVVAMIDYGRQLDDVDGTAA